MKESAAPRFCIKYVLFELNLFVLNFFLKYVQQRSDRRVYLAAFFISFLKR